MRIFSEKSVEANINPNEHSFFYKALAICRIFWTSEAEIKLMVTKGKRCCKMANLNDSDHMLKITYK